MKIKKREVDLAAVQCGDDVAKSVAEFALKHKLEITDEQNVFADGRGLVTLVDPNGDGRNWTLDPTVWIVFDGAEFEGVPDDIFKSRYEVEE